MAISSEAGYSRTIYNGRESEELIEKLFPGGLKNILLCGEYLEKSPGRKATASETKRIALMNIGERTLHNMETLEFAGIMVVDTPFARLSSFKREKAMSIFEELARKGQVVLLLHPAEMEGSNDKLPGAHVLDYLENEVMVISGGTRHNSR